MKFSSGERRGAVLLLILTGVIIAVVFLLRSDPDLQSLPAVEVSESERLADTVGTVAERDLPESTSDDEKSRRRNSAKAARGRNREAASGAQRDFLDEPVAGQ